jgi:FdrA protein
MRAAAIVQDRPGIAAASLMMGTDVNKQFLKEAGLLAPEAAEAGPNDLVIAVSGDPAALEGALDQAEAELRRASGSVAPGAEVAVLWPKTIAQARQAVPGLNLALISTPGRYAAAEALKALRSGLHVFLFSNNVDVDDERMLKTEAARRGLLMMGPDCGTAILNGVPLGFANVVRSGDIGLAGSSGTGLQQVSSLIDRAGAGVSQVIGVGSRDLSEQIAGASLLPVLDALAADPATRVIGLVSKPPAPRVAELALDRSARVGKPVVACFLGARMDSPSPSVRCASTLAEAAALLVELSVGSPRPVGECLDPPLRGPSGRGRWLRALYSGGTFAYECRVVIGDRLGTLAGTAGHYLPGRPPDLPQGHLVLDLGADEFTVGRPHPMIDPSTRLEFLRACREPETAVVLLDVVIGHSAAADPAAALAPVVADLTADGGPAVVSFVCGTDGDPQGRRRQELALAKAGALILPSSTAAALAAVRIVEGVR